MVHVGVSSRCVLVNDADTVVRRRQMPTMPGTLLHAVTIGDGVRPDPGPQQLGHRSRTSEARRRGRTGRGARTGGPRRPRPGRSVSRWSCGCGNVGRRPLRVGHMAGERGQPGSVAG